MLNQLINTMLRAYYFNCALMLEKAIIKTSCVHPAIWSTLPRPVATQLLFKSWLASRYQGSYYLKASKYSADETQTLFSTRKLNKSEQLPCHKSWKHVYVELVTHYIRNKKIVKGENGNPNLHVRISILHHLLWDFRLELQL